jgi:pSer/pThr/pTyr-binding forkhead associated (FHA) protein
MTLACTRYHVPSPSLVFQASKMHIKGDPAVSERHGVITWTVEGWTLTDVGSSNGTLVNGERLEANGGAVGRIAPHTYSQGALP